MSKEDLTKTGHARRRPGRPLSPDADEAIMDATIEVLSERGFGGLTMEEVATRARVGKTTIYRRWPSKQALVAAVMRGRVGELPVPDTGSVREDLVIYVRALGEIVTTPPGPQILRALAFEIWRDPALREPWLETIAARRAATRGILERGVERGELRPDIDYAVVQDTLTAPSSYRVLVTGEQVPETFAESVVDSVLRGVRAT